MMEEVIVICSLIGTLAFAVVVVYCCLIKGAMQDEIDEKYWEEFCGKVG